MEAEAEATFKEKAYAAKRAAEEAASEMIARYVLTPDLTYLKSDIPYL